MRGSSWLSDTSGASNDRARVPARFRRGDDFRSRSLFADLPREICSRSYNVILFRLKRGVDYIIRILMASEFNR